jgi:Kelch motif
MADESVEQRRSNNVPAASTVVLSPSSSVRRGKGQSLTWSRIPVCGPDALVPPPRSGAASVVVKDKLYVFGGYGGGTGRLDDFWSYSFKNSVWENVEVLSDRKPDCRENNGVVISDANRSIYLFGGYNGVCVDGMRRYPVCSAERALTLLSHNLSHARCR